MLQALKTVLRVVLTLVIVIAINGANAQNKPTDLFPSNGGPLLHLSSALANGKVTISWPVMAGTWELMTQKPAYTGEWKPIANDLYRTNATTVSITTAVTDKPVLYRLRRHFPQRPPGFPMLPPMPPPPTNRQAPPKLPGHG